jgi:hypothetical protein
VKRFWHFTVLKDGIEKNKENIKKKNWSQNENSFDISLSIVTMKYKNKIKLVYVN